MNEEDVRKILLEYYQADYYPNIREDFAKEICQLFQKPDEGRLLTHEKEIAIVEACPYSDRLWYKHDHEIAKEQDAKTASIKDAEIEEIFRELRNKVAIEYRKSIDESEANPFPTIRLNEEHKIIWLGHANAYSEVISELDRIKKEGK